MGNNSDSQSEDPVKWGQQSIIDSADSDPYHDAADRLERTIDTQVEIINGIDNKAEHVTRLIGILIGLVFSVLSLVANFDSVTIGATTLPVELAFIFGILSLLISMAGAIITYLSSRFRIGLHYNVGYFLSNEDSEIDSETHIRRVLGAYGSMLEENKEVIEVNSKRFRRTLCFLLIGVLFLSTAGSLYIGQVTGLEGWIGFGIAVILATIAAWYIFTGRYLTLEHIT